MSLLDPHELAQLLPAESASFASPIPTQFVASDEFSPLPQTARQKEVEARIKDLGNRLAKHQGLSRRKFFKTAAGMAAAFVAMNDVYGPVFGVSSAEAATPDMANERAKSARGPVHHGHAHAFPARRHAPRRLREIARGRRPGGLESGVGRQAANARRPQVRELFQGNLFRQRHQGRADLGLRLGGAARLVPHQRNEGRCARQGQQAHRLAAHVLARDLPARHAGLDGRGGPRDRRTETRFHERLRGRRQHQQASRQASVAPGRRKAALPVLREGCESRARQRVRAQRAVSTTRRPRIFRTWSNMRTCATWAGRRRIGRS